MIIPLCIARKGIEIKATLPSVASSMMAIFLPVAVMLPSLEDENNLTPRNTTPIIKPPKSQARSQPSDNDRGGRFPQILDVFQGLKIGVPCSGCLGETSIFKIMIDDVTLWSKLKSTW